MAGRDSGAPAHAPGSLDWPSTLRLHGPGRVRRGPASWTGIGARLSGYTEATGNLPD